MRLLELQGPWVDAEGLLASGGQIPAPVRDWCRDQKLDRVYVRHVSVDVWHALGVIVMFNTYDHATLVLVRWLRGTGAAGNCHTMLMRDLELVSRIDVDEWYACQVVALLAQ